MTTAEMISALSSTLDEFGSIPTTFYTNPDDYLIALNNAQLQEVQDAVDAPVRYWRNVRNLVVTETITDGATLANECYVPLSVYDSGNQIHMTVVNKGRFVAYQDCAIPSWGIATIEGNTIKTAPAGKTVVLRYIKYPATLAVGTDSNLDPVCHARIVANARPILLRKDIDSSLLDAIEPDRNKLEVFKQARSAASGFAPRETPYSNR